MAGPFSDLPEVPQIDLGATFSDAGSSVSGAFSNAGSSISGAFGDGGSSIGGAISGAAGGIGASLGFGGGSGEGFVGFGGSGLMAKKKGFGKAHFVPSGNPDWRVKIKVPDEYMELAGEGILKPLQSTDGYLVFPYTPDIALISSAQYTPTRPVHSNYPFYSYQNSAVTQVTISGDFTVETEDEGKYWIAAKHFLMSASKMAYGENEILPTGSPPPVLKLSGYGDHIFNNTSIVIENVTMPLPTNVDYMLISNFANDVEGTYVPVNSTFTVGCIFIHSRQKVKTFSLDSFVRGDYVATGEFL